MIRNGKMDFREHDKPILKDINSNLLQAQRTDNPVAKLEYFLKVANASVIFAYVLRNRKDYEHAMEYIRQAEKINKDIADLIAQIRGELELEAKK